MLADPDIESKWVSVYAAVVSWLEIYIPLDRLDTGLRILLAVWLATVVAGFAIWLRARARDPEQP